MKKSGIIVISVILAIVIIFIVAGLWIYLTKPIITESTIGGIQCSGGSVTSISNAQIYTSGDMGGKKVIRVTFSTLPSSECLLISLKPSDINNALSDADKAKFTATNTILGDIRMTKEQKVYNINERTGETFQKFDIKLGKRNWINSCTDSDCQSKYGSGNFINSPYVGLNDNCANQNGCPKNYCGSDNCCCAYFGGTGINGEFSVSESFNWEVKVDIGSDSATFTQNQLSGKVGNIAFAKWAGNLVSNDQLGSITGRQAYKPYSDNQWRMIDLGTYTDLNNKFNSYYTALKNCQNSIGVGDCNTQLTNVFAYNSDFDTKTANHLQNWINGNTIVKSASISSNKMIVDLKSAVIYQQFTLDIDASSVGIFITSGQPKVSCPSNIEKLISGQTKDVSINLQNIGSNSGSFTYGITCNKGSQVLQPSPPQQFNAGTSQSITARLGLTVVSGEDTASCTFSANDINNPNNRDSCSFSYTAKHQSDCIEGTKSCELGNTELWTCRADGTYDKTKCDYGCEGFENTYRCRLQNDSCPTGQTRCSDNVCRTNCSSPCEGHWYFLWIDKLFCPSENNGECQGHVYLLWIDGAWCKFTKWLSQVILTISIIFGLLGGIIAMLICNGLITKNNLMQSNKKWIINLIVGVIVGFAVSFLTYNFWWVGLIALVIFIIFKWIF